MQMPALIEPAQMAPRDFPRGCLIDFRCHFDGRPRCRWRAIYHGNGQAHTVGNRIGGPWLMSGLLPGDRVEKIPHGYRIVRDLDEPQHAATP